MNVIPDTHWHAAYDWLCLARHHWPANADVWDLRWRWQHAEHAGCSMLYNKVKSGEYRLSPLVSVSIKDGGSALVWSSEDALVLKWLTLHLQSRLPLHAACVHVRGRGGVADARRRVFRLLRDTNELRRGYVFRTDIKGYYSNITTALIRRYVLSHVADDVHRGLMMQFADISVDNGGNLFTPKGIVRGCALSPLIGAALLYDTDCEMAGLAKNGVHYLRFMDDLLFLSPTRWLMRRAREKLLEQMDDMGFDLHPDKTQPGRLPQLRFDWLGWEFHENGVSPAPRAWLHHKEQLIQREAALRQQRRCEADIRQEIERYKRRWVSWFMSGMPEDAKAVCSLPQEYQKWAFDKGS